MGLRGKRISENLLEAVLRSLIKVPLEQQPQLCIFVESGNFIYEGAIIDPEQSQVKDGGKEFLLGIRVQPDVPTIKYLHWRKDQPNNGEDEITWLALLE